MKARNKHVPEGTSPSSDGACSRDSLCLPLPLSWALTRAREPMVMALCKGCWYGRSSSPGWTQLASEKASRPAGTIGRRSANSAVTWRAGIKVRTLAMVYLTRSVVPSPLSTQCSQWRACAMRLADGGEERKGSAHQGGHHFLPNLFHLHFRFLGVLPIRERDQDFDVVPYRTEVEPGVVFGYGHQRLRLLGREFSLGHWSV